MEPILLFVILRRITVYTEIQFQSFGSKFQGQCAQKCAHCVLHWYRIEQNRIGNSDLSSLISLFIDYIAQDLAA